MNNVSLVGRLTKDPILRYVPNSGKAVTRFSIAVDREFSKDKEADFFNIAVWGKLAEHVANYLAKGRLVAVSGSLRNNNYEDKNGTKHYAIEVLASTVQFLDYGRNSHPNSKNTQYQNNQSNQHNNHGNHQDNMQGFQAIEGDDDIPF